MNSLRHEPQHIMATLSSDLLQLVVPAGCCTIFTAICPRHLRAGQEARAQEEGPAAQRHLLRSRNHRCSSGSAC